MTNQNKILIAIATVFFIALFAILAMLIIKIERLKQPQQNQDSTLNVSVFKRSIEANIIKNLELRFSSRKKTDTTIVNNYFKTYNNAVKEAPDTCKYYIEKLHLAADSMRKSKDSLIDILTDISKHKDSVIAIDSTIKSVYLKQLKDTSNTLTDTRKELVKSNKKAKRNFWFGFGLGAAATGGGAYLLKR